MISVVFDTVVLVRSLINPFGVCGRLVFDYEEAYRLLISTPVLREVLEVLFRSSLRSKFKSLADRDVAWVLARLERADVVEIGAIANVCRDPEDDKFLATAVVAGAGYLVSEDQDLLVLREYQGVAIVNAASFLTILQESMHW